MLTYNPAFLKRWRAGILPKEWQRKYPDIFDEDDLRIALAQPRYHFGEWTAAMHYAKEGYGVLIEKYLYENHDRKLKIISRLLAPAQILFLRHPKPRHMPPDLFIYRDKEHFFAEVKRDGDRLNKSQENCFRNIEKKLKYEVRIVILKAQ